MIKQMLIEFDFFCFSADDKKSAPDSKLYRYGTACSYLSRLGGQTTLNSSQIL